MGRHVKCRVVNFDPLRRRAPSEAAGYFFRASLFDRDVIPCRCIDVDRGHRPRHIERDMMMFCKHCHGIGSDFICRVAVCRNPVASYDDSVDLSLFHQHPRHIVRDDRHIYPCLLQAPMRSDARPAKAAWSRLHIL